MLFSVQTLQIWIQIKCCPLLEPQTQYFLLVRDEANERPRYLFILLYIESSIAWNYTYRAMKRLPLLIASFHSDYFSNWGQSAPRSRFVDMINIVQDSNAPDFWSQPQLPTNIAYSYKTNRASRKRKLTCAKCAFDVMIRMMKMLVLRWTFKLNCAHMRQTFNKYSVFLEVDRNETKKKLILSVILRVCT